MLRPGASLRKYSVLDQCNSRKPWHLRWHRRRSPSSQLPKSLPVYVKRILGIIREAGSTDSEMVQHCLKSLATIMHDCPQSKIKGDDLIFLLEILIPDIEDSERQVAAFALLRAIVERKFVVPEIYDVLEKVARSWSQISRSKSKSFAMVFYCSSCSIIHKGRVD